MIAEIKTKINNLLTLEPGNTTWGIIFDLALGGVCDGLEWLWANKAPFNHAHPEGGGGVALAFGTAAERAALEPTAPMSFEEKDTRLKWFYFGGDPYDSTKWVCNGRPYVPAPIRLPIWQTDPEQYTVLRQDAYDSNGHGADLFYHHVFKAAQTSVMYCEILAQYGGYDLELNFSYRMSSSHSGNVVWALHYEVVQQGESDGEISLLSGWSADDTAYLTDTPYTSANYENFVSADLTIPASAYSAGQKIKLVLARNGTSGSDTHTGNAEVSDDILLQPMAPA